MAPTFLILSGDGHGFMNCYRTLTLIEIHKLPTLVMIVFKKCAKAGHVSWCDLVTYDKSIAADTMDGET